MSQERPLSLQALSSWTRAWFAFVLLLTATLCLVWSHYKLFWVDEVYEYYLDTQPSLQAVVAEQMHAPVLLEPVYLHLLIHAVHRVLPSAVLASRLISILALLVTEVCVFFLALWLSGEEAAAATAMMLPLFFVTLDYGPEARGYSVLTASLAVGLLSWFLAAQRESRRGLALAGLTLSVAVAVTTHYFGFGVPLVLAAAEAVRVWQRRRVDWPVLAALLLGSAALILDLPFQHALLPFRAHAFDEGQTRWGMIGLTYLWMVHAAAHSPSALRWMEPTAAFSMLVFFVWVGRDIVKRISTTQPAWLAAACLFASALPFVNVGVAQIAKAYVPRYSLPAVVGLCVLLPTFAYAFGPLRRARNWIVGALLLLSLRQCYEAVRVSKHARVQVLGSFSLDPAQTAALAAVPGPSIYVQDLDRLLVYRFYAPAPLQQRLVGFYSASCEQRWHQRPISLFSQNLGQTTPMKFAEFSQVADTTTPRLLILYHEPAQEWIEAELQSDGAIVTPLGPLAGGELVRIDFKAGSSHC